MKTYLTILLAFLCLPICEAAKLPQPLLDSTVKILTGAAASVALANSVEAQDIRGQEKEIARDLKAKGIDTTNGAIFSLFFQVNPDASGRWIFNPNIYARVQIEGQEDFVPASIATNYHGQEWIVSVYGQQIRPGGRVLVHILDDKQFWNTAFNSILQMELPLRVSATLSLTPSLKARVEAGGNIRLLDRDVVLQRPGYVATADFTAPNSSDSVWVASADLIKDGKKVGDLQFGQVWKSPPRSNTLWKAAFWGGLAVVLGALFVRGLMSRQGSSSSAEAATG